MRDSTGALLEQFGYDVLPAADGAEALDVFQQRLDEIGLVLLDIMMPVMDGAECFSRLKEIRPETKVLLFSGYSSEDQAERMLAEGAAGFLQKPFTARALADAVQRALGG